MPSKNEDPQPMTAEQVLQLIKQQNETFLQGVERMRIPYVDPLKVADRKRQIEEDRARYAAELARQQREQDSCPHLRFDKSSTFWPFECSDEVIRLICCRCQKQVGPEDSKYRDILYATASVADIR